MQTKHLLAIFLFSLLAFSPAFFRPLPYGMDSFYFLAQTCGEKGFETQPIGAILAFSLLPCNILALKTLFFGCCFVSALFAAKLGELISPKNGWLASIFVYATPLWLLEFWKIENDALAYPLLFAGAYFFYKGIKQKGLKSKLLGILLVCIAQTIWTGSVLWLIAFSLTWIWIAIPTLTGLAANFWKFIGQIAPKFNSATENLPAYGLLYQAFLFTALMYVKETGILIAPTIFFTVIAFSNAKFAIHASFLLAIAATKQFECAKTAFVKWLPLAGAITVSLFLTAMSPGLPPDSQEVEAGNLAVAEAEGETICNDWGTGHLIEYLGGKPLAKGGGEQLCQGCENCIVLSYRHFDCPMVNDANSDTELRVYRC